MFNTPTTLTRTPERAINTSPFRGANLSDKSRNINYPAVAHQIGNYFHRETSQFDPQTSVDNYQENLKYITQQCEYYKNQCEELKNKQLREQQLYFELEKQNKQCQYINEQQQQQIKEYEKEINKKNQVAIQLEGMIQSMDTQLQDNDNRINRMTKQLKQQENEIIELKLKLQNEQQLREKDSFKLIQQFKKIHEEAQIQNEQLIKENEILKENIYKISNRQSLDNDEQNFQTNTDFLDENELKSLIEEYLLNNDYALLQIPDKQLIPAIQLIKNLFLQNYNQQTQLEKIDIKELKAKKNYIIQEIKSKMNLLSKSSIEKIDQIAFSKEIEKLKIELQKIEQLIESNEQAQLFNPHKNSCVSLQDQEFK